MYDLINLNKNGKYLGYLRKSRTDLFLEKTKQVDTLKEHKKFILNRIKQLGISIDTWYEEVVSGDTINDRPEIKKLLKVVESGQIDGVLVVDIDRLARGDTTDQGIISRTFKYTNTKIITLAKIYDPNNEEDEDFFEFNLFMARKEYKAINKRQQRGRISSVLNGKYCGSSSPYGYDRVKIKGDKGFTLSINDDEANVVKMIFNKRKNGDGLNIICNYLNNLGITPRKSDVWTPATLTTILTNPIYIGKIRWNYNKTCKSIKNGEIVKFRKKSNSDDIILVEGLHPAIIDDETFNIVSKEKIPNDSVKSNLSIQNPLTGLVKCSVCGRTMVRRPYATTRTVRCENNLDKDKLLACLREHKWQYSLSQIAKLSDCSKYVVDRWFSKNFVVPKYDDWLKIKQILNITTDEFDEDIKLYHSKNETEKVDSLICPKAHCLTVSSHLYLVEERILKMTNDYLNSKKQLMDYYSPNQQNEDTEAIEVYKKKIKDLEKQLDKAYELVENNVYTAEEFTQRTKKIKSNIETNKKELTKLLANSNTKNLKPMLAIAEKIINNYHSIDSIEEKNKLLKSIINNVEYIKIKGGKSNIDNFDLKIAFKL